MFITAGSILGLFFKYADDLKIDLDKIYLQIITAFVGFS